MTFSVQIENEVTRIDRIRKEITKTKSFRLQFIDNTIFVASSSLNLGNNLAQEILKIKCKCEHDD